MRIGIFGGSYMGSVERVLGGARQTAEQGFERLWLPQIFGIDALTALAAVGHAVPRLGLGTAVVPTFPRHPVVMAEQALTVQAASGGRFVLGVGLSHQVAIEGRFGIPFEKPVRHLREYLSILVPLLRGEPVAYEGETLKASGGLDVPGADPVPVVVAALGAQTLRVAGALADGTVTWCVGPRTLASHTVPTIRRAADEAGRDEPQVVCGLPVCVTDDLAGARARAAEVFEIYGQLPSYRAMLDLEGVAGPEDLAVVGSEEEVGEQVAALADLGVTDFCAAEFPGSDEERVRTRDALQSLLGA
jgi:F420-dependent oxidoreductase-like protein